LKNHDVKLVIVGTGSYLPNLKKMAVKLDISDKVIFTGKVSGNDLPKYYNLADIFKVLPIVDLQLNTKATSKSKASGKQRVIVDDPTSKLHKDMPIAGTLGVIKGKKLSPYYTLNPYCMYDPVTRCIKYHPDDEKQLAKLKSIIEKDQNRSKTEIPIEFISNKS